MISLMRYIDNKHVYANKIFGRDLMNNNNYIMFYKKKKNWLKYLSCIFKKPTIYVLENNIWSHITRTIIIILIRRENLFLYDIDIISNVPEIYEKIKKHFVIKIYLHKNVSFGNTTTKSVSADLYYNKRNTM